MDYLIDVLYSFVVLDLADELDVRSVLWIFFSEVRSEFGQICPVSCETDGDVVDLVLDAELDDVVLVVCPDGR